MYDYNYPFDTKLSRNTRTGSRDVKTDATPASRPTFWPRQSWPLGFGLCLLCLEHLASLNVPGCWLDNEVRVSLCSLGRTYHRRTLREAKTTKKATGKPPWQIHVRLWVCSRTILRCRHSITAPHLEYHP